MYILITSKYHENLIINSREKVQLSFFPIQAFRGFFSDAQRQTPQLVVGSTQMSNSSEISCMSSLPTSIKKDLDESIPRKSGDSICPIVSLWELSVAIGTGT